MFERELRDLAFVPRWVIARKIHQQSVAEHSFFVAVYADQIARVLGWPMDGTPSKVDRRRLDLLRAALWHDAEECATGDIPGPAKKKLVPNPHHRKVTSYEYKTARFGHHDWVTGQWEPAIDAILHTANLLEECLYLSGEVQMGNRAVSHMLQASTEALMKSLKELPLIDRAREERLASLIWKALDREEHETSRLITLDSMTNTAVVDVR